MDLYYSPQGARVAGDKPVPLVVFIYGGAWGSGDRSIYCLLARRMAEELGATVACPDYVTYPKVRPPNPSITLNELQNERSAKEPVRDRI